ncbi:MAG TPA: hypothetical protein VKB80_30545 [Kofleriaceae bacterium]|nr:hypothetical protein [Kofleriaceae bacterium]
MRQQRGTRRRFRTLPMLLLLAMVAIVVGYLRCGDGLGLGGGGRGEGGRGDGSGAKDGKDASRKDSEVRPAVGGGGGGEGRVSRCKLRLDSKGLSLDGRPSATDEAVAECKKAGAELTVTGDAVVGESDELQQALTRAGVEVFVRERVVPEK